jgi:murein DD-endopeptidase MepM/ murein hydrolase activator NlpD
VLLTGPVSEAYFGASMSMGTGRRWTIMLVPHSSDASRAAVVTERLVKRVVGAGSLVLLVFVALGVAAVGRAVSVTRYGAFVRQNRALVDEVQRVREHVTVLRDSLEILDRGGQQLRLLAGLHPLDPAVLQAGIGGPTGKWPERDSLLALGADGAQALAARTELDGLMRRATILASSVRQAYDSLSSHEARFAATPSIMPARGPITSPFASARLDPVLHAVRPHEGIDIGAPMGARIVAPAAGVVVDVSRDEGYGNLLTIAHGYGVVTRYAHCSKILVVRGQRVKRGQKVAVVGETGYATGPHLHYEVWVNGRAVDPQRFLLPEDAIAD